MSEVSVTLMLHVYMSLLHVCVCVRVCVHVCVCMYVCACVADRGEVPSSRVLQVI